MNSAIKKYREDMEQELHHILGYWSRYTVDETHGGFVGRIDNDNTIYADAPKGSVLNSRILWSFAAAYTQTEKEAYLLLADRAYRYIIDHFVDKEYGGVYWSVDARGNPLDSKKQIYAVAFTVYALSEYYQCRPMEEVRNQAIALYEDIVRYSYDQNYGGYMEALTREWKEIGDGRLSVKDANEKKSMNTHLHVLEAFTTLYRIWPDGVLRQRIIELAHIFLDHIIDGRTHHLILFFDERWHAKSDTVSYGHDIEAAWLLQEAAEVVDDGLLLSAVKKRCVQVAEAARRGLDRDGGLWYEFEPGTNHLVREKHWWPQSEAMVGFFNAWQNTGNEAFLQHSLGSWQFTRERIRDQRHGEWFWGVREDYSVMNEDKVGLWKCPYHNSRACIEILRRTGLNYINGSSQ